MKISYNWLKQFINLDWEPEKTSRNIKLFHDKFQFDLESKVACETLVTTSSAASKHHLMTLETFKEPILPYIGW